MNECDADSEHKVIQPFETLINDRQARLRDHASLSFHTPILRDSRTDEFNEMEIERDEVKSHEKKRMRGNSFFAAISLNRSSLAAWVQWLRENEK